MTVLLFCTHQPKSENQTSDVKAHLSSYSLKQKKKSDQISVYHDVFLQNRKLLISNPCSRITTCSDSPVSSRLHLTGPYWIPNPHPVPNRYYTPEEYLWFREVFILSTAAVKSCQSYPTLCDPIDGSPTGSSVPGILQARILEWVAISFSSSWKWKVKVKSLSHVQLLATPWTVAYQASPSMGFSKQEYWSGVPSPSPVCVYPFSFGSNLSRHTENSEILHGPFCGPTIIIPLAFSLIPLLARKVNPLLYLSFLKQDQQNLSSIQPSKSYIYSIYWTPRLYHIKIPSQTQEDFSRVAWESHRPWGQTGKLTDFRNRVATFRSRVSNFRKEKSEALWIRKPRDEKML